MLLVRALMLCALYVAAGKLGLSLAFAHASATPVWPPTGIALAGLLVFGRRLWPAVFAGAFIVNITTAESFPSSLAIAAGNTVEALAGVELVGRFARGRYFVDRAWDFVKFSVLAGVLSTAVSATIGVTALVLGGSAAWTSFTMIWFTWWLGDASGALLVTPVLVL
jgi:integral membrane sensor domain MASE1